MIWCIGWIALILGACLVIPALVRIPRSKSVVTIRQNTSDGGNAEASTPRLVPYRTSQASPSVSVNAPTNPSGNGSTNTRVPSELLHKWQLHRQVNCSIANVSQIPIKVARYLLRRQRQAGCKKLVAWKPWGAGLGSNLNVLVMALGTATFHNRCAILARTCMRINTGSVGAHSTT